MSIRFGISTRREVQDTSQVATRFRAVLAIGVGRGMPPSDVSLHSTSIGVIDSDRQSVNTEMLDRAKTNLHKACSLKTQHNVDFLKRTIELVLAKHPLPINAVEPEKLIIYYTRIINKCGFGNPREAATDWKFARDIRDLLTRVFSDSDLGKYVRTLMLADAKRRLALTRSLIKDPEIVQFIAKIEDLSAVNPFNITDDEAAELIHVHNNRLVGSGGPSEDGKFEEASRELLKKFFSDARLGDVFKWSGPTEEKGGEDHKDYSHFVKGEPLAVVKRKRDSGVV